MVKIIQTKTGLNQYLNEHREKNRSIGFVPTMGALHEGHMNLIRKCLSNNDITVVSIFVNPTQFDDPDDYRNYPKTQEKDIEKLEEVNCDVLFLPDEAEMYPEGKDELLDFDPGFIGQVLEGRFRPGHFQGVATIVKKLFDAVRPDKTYFGQKDYQQLLIIRKLVKEFEFPIEIIPIPTARESDGLAISSRNVLLTEEQRKIAPVIYKTLQWIKEQLLEGKSVMAVQKEAYKHLERQPEISVEYIEIRDANTLATIRDLSDARELVICAAIHLGKVRLIDNILVSKGT